jgi:hypothetical protein
VTTPLAVEDYLQFFSTTGGTASAPLPEGVTARFDQGIPAALQPGLRSVAARLTQQQNGLEPNTTITLALDLRSVRGPSSAFRFTYVEHAAARGRPATGEILVESMVRPAATPGTPPPAPGSSGPTPQERFAQHGFRSGGGWSSRERASLLQAIASVPDSTLAPISGLRFERDTAGSNDPQAGGEYNPDTHTVTMFDRAFAQAGAQVRYGTPGAALIDESTRDIIHEIGHALDLLPLRLAWRRITEAQVAIRNAFAEFEDPPGSGLYNFPSTEQASWNRLSAQLAAAERARDATVSLSGSRWQAPPGGGEMEIVDGPAGARNTAFRQAAERDRQAGGRGAQRITSFSDGAWHEYWAESYSLYVAAPDQLRDLRPQVYAYFEARFPRQGQSASAPTSPSSP